MYHINIISNLLGHSKSTPTSVYYHGYQHFNLLEQQISKVINIISETRLFQIQVLTLIKDIQYYSSRTWYC